MTLTLETCWEFHCPECGLGHHELGHLAKDHEIHCVICEHETGRLVTLARWLADDTSSQARLRDDLPD